MKPIVIDLFAGNMADKVKQIGNAVCPKMAEALAGGQ